MKIDNVLLLGGLICLGISFLVSGVIELILAIVAVVLIGLSFFFGVDIDISIDSTHKKKREEQ